MLGFIIGVIVGIPGGWFLCKKFSPVVADIVDAVHK